MRAFLASTALAVALFSAPAVAADLSQQSFSAPANQYDWTGVYAGAHAGYGWLNGKDNFGGSSSFDGFIGGLYLGYNHMFDQFMIGAEIDGSLMDIGGTSSPGNKFDMNWGATARLRAGLAYDRFLVYATGGLSVADLETKNTVRGTKSSNTHTGWVLGAGIEAFVTEAVSARLEYLHHDFGNKTYNLGAADFKLKGQLDVVRAGVAYHF
ncbi:outer membrane protein [Stappia indica]|uniref:outer membrane protein n=1 Tax=Stappia indica TaxID=538381 RepID=UPI001CD272B0|nr:outer membrane protein [Stappia indica]MCA1299904.1 porin family protein [Stappia indica]